MCSAVQCLVARASSLETNARHCAIYVLQTPVFVGLFTLQLCYSLFNLDPRAGQSTQHKPKEVVETTQDLLGKLPSSSSGLSMLIPQDKWV